MHLDERIEEIGFGWAQVLQILVAGSVYLADGAELLLVGAVTMALRDEWSLSGTERAMVVSIVFIGTAVGNICSGPWGDTAGRRLPILVSFFGVGLFSVISALCQGFWCLCPIRFMVGFAFGLGIPAWNTLAGEISPAEYRIHSCILSMPSFAVGEMYSAFLIWLDDPQMKDLNWRWLILMGAIPCVVLLIVGYFVVYESPRYLAIHDKYVEACGVLQDMAVKNGKAGMVVDFVPPILPPKENVFDRTKANLRIIWGSNLAFTTFVTCFGSFTMNFAYYGGGMYALARLLPDLQMNVSPAMSLMWGAVAEIPGAFAVVAVGMYLSRKITWQVTILGLALSTIALVWFAASLSGHKDAAAIDATTEVAMGTSIFLFKMFAAMLFGIVYLYSIEVYPTTARHTGTGLCMTFGRFGSISSPLIYEWLHHYTGSFLWFFYLMLALFAVNSVLVLLLPFETKGVSLKDRADEIEPLAQHS